MAYLRCVNAVPWHPQSGPERGTTIIPLGYIGPRGMEHHVEAEREAHAERLRIEAEKKARERRLREPWPGGEWLA